MDSSRLVQVTNLSTHCSRDQLKTLFSYIGPIEETELYPESETLISTVGTKVGYIRFARSESARIAIHLTNVIFVEKQLIVMVVADDHEIPDEAEAIKYCAPLNPNITLIAGGPTWYSTIINRVVGQGVTAQIETLDDSLAERGLPTYPNLTADLDHYKAEETRRTVYIGDIDPQITLEMLEEFLSQIGEVKYMRLAYDEGDVQNKSDDKENNTDKPMGAYVEFTDIGTVAKSLCLNGFDLLDRIISVNHATCVVSKSMYPPLTKIVTIGRAESHRHRSRSRSGKRSSLRSRSHSSTTTSTRTGRTRASRRRSRSRQRRHHRSRSSARTDLSPTASRYGRSSYHSRHQQPSSYDHYRRTMHPVSHYGYSSRRRCDSPPRRRSPNRRHRSSSDERRRSRERHRLSITSADHRRSRERRSRERRSRERRSRERRSRERRSRERGGLKIKRLSPDKRSSRERSRDRRLSESHRRAGSRNLRSDDRKSRKSRENAVNKHQDSIHHESLLPVDRSTSRERRSKSGGKRLRNSVVRTDNEMGMSTKRAKSKPSEYSEKNGVLKDSREGLASCDESLDLYADLESVAEQSSSRRRSDKHRSRSKDRTSEGRIRSSKRTDGGGDKDRKSKSDRNWEGSDSRDHHRSKRDSSSRRLPRHRSRDREGSSKRHRKHRKSEKSCSSKQHKSSKKSRQSDDASASGTQSG